MFRVFILGILNVTFLKPNVLLNFNIMFSANIKILIIEHWQNHPSGQQDTHFINTQGTSSTRLLFQI